MPRRSTGNGLDLFFTHVVKPNGEGGCWLWTGTAVPRGYGTLKFHQERWYSHRFAFNRLVGPIPEGLLVCHTCDNPPCVNPAHLFLGSHEDNMQDMKDKGRSRYGERVNTSRLTESEVRSIHARCYDFQTKQDDIAADFGVSRRLVGLVASGKVWKHLNLTPIPRRKTGPKR